MFKCSKSIIRYSKIYLLLIIWISKFLCNVLNSKIEISEKTRIIDSPEYLEYLQNDSENMNTVDRNNNAKEVSDFLILLFFSFL